MPSWASSDGPRIVGTGACPGAADDLARLMEAVWPDWYGPGGPGDARADLAARGDGDTLPLGLVALSGGAVVGGAALEATSHGALPGETPWLTGLLVAPHLRRRGFGGALVEAVTRLAAGRGDRTLFATTGSAAGLLACRGWRRLRPVPGEAAAVFVKTPLGPA